MFAFVLHPSSRAAAARDAEELRRKRHLMFSGALAMFFLMVGAAMTYLWREAEVSNAKAVENEKKALANEAKAVEAGVKRVEMIRTVVEHAKDLVGSAQAGVDEATRQAGVLTATLVEAREKAPPEESEIEQFARARVLAKQTVEALGQLATTAHEAASETDDEHIAADAALIAGQAEDLIGKLQELDLNSGVFAAADTAIGVRLDTINAGLDAATAAGAGVAKQESGVAAATADLDAIAGILRAASAFGWDKDDFAERSVRADQFRLALNGLRGAVAAVHATTLQRRTASDAVALRHGGKVNRVRFAPVAVDGALLLAAACEDKQVYFWRPGRRRATGKVVDPERRTRC